MCATRAVSSRSLLRNRRCEIQGRSTARQRRHRGSEAAVANGIEADHAGRLQIGTVNGQFIAAGAGPSEYKAAPRAAIERGYLITHPSGVM
jgi:hypothetical protein